MACSNDIQLNDIGTSFEIDITDTDKDCVTLPVDLTSATNIAFKFFKVESETSIDRGGTVFTGGLPNGDATDGIVQYISIAGDLDEEGPWQGQVTITFATGDVFNSTIFNFNVKANLI